MFKQLRGSPSIGSLPFNDYVLDYYTSRMASGQLANMAWFGYGAYMVG